jgi:hypothetical protein
LLSWWHGPSEITGTSVFLMVCSLI